MDISERDFMPTVAQWLVNVFPNGDVHQEEQISTGRYPDFRIELDFLTIMVEVENRADEVIEGFGQARDYASVYPSAMTIVVYPVEDENEPTPRVVSRLNPTMAIVGLPVNYGGD